MDYFIKMKSIILILLCCACYSLTQKSDSDDTFLNSQQLIRKYKYICEKHSVQTEDGYILTIFRIPGKGPPLLLAHGIGDSSDSWLVLGPKHSLAFLLSDVGFDIWILNVRGNKYSKKHVKQLTRKQYWRFTFEEMGTRDLPTTIDYILSVTGESKLTYIGYSQGTTIFFVMCDLKPEYNEKIYHAVLIAPVAWIHNSNYPFMGILSQNLAHLVKLSEQLQLYELFTPNQLRSRYHSEVCKQDSETKYLCTMEYFLSYGLNNYSHIAPDKFPIIASHIPAGVSASTMFHFVQNYKTGKFQKFDYEIGSNRRINKQYQNLLPEYNVSSVRVPITMIASATDWFSDPKDVNRLRSSLRSITNYIHIREEFDFSHIEFVYGSRVNALVNKPLIKVLLNLFDMKR